MKLNNYRPVKRIRPLPIWGVMIGLSLFASSLSAFMFQSNDGRPRRPGLFPVVDYRIGALPVPAVLEAEWLCLIRESAGRWFRTGEAKFNFSDAGRTNQAKPLVPADLSCSGATKQILSDSGDAIYTKTVADPDCTAAVCTMVWSCGDEILHADTQVNAADFAFGIDPSLSGRRLARLLTHAFGHAAGLDHCSPGDTFGRCREQHGVDYLDPPPTAVMHRFWDISDSLFDADDRAGIRKLYGEYTIPFPVSGKYALRDDEIELLSDAENDQFQSDAMHPMTTTEIRSTAVELMTLIPQSPVDIDRETDAWQNGQGYTPPRLTPQQAREESLRKMNGFYSSVSATIPQLDGRSLAVARANSVLAVDAFERIKGAIAGDSNIDPDVLRMNLENLMRMRREAIDEELRRAP